MTTVDVGRSHDDRRFGIAPDDDWIAGDGIHLSLSRTAMYHDPRLRQQLLRLLLREDAGAFVVVAELEELHKPERCENDLDLAVGLHERDPAAAPLQSHNEIRKVRQRDARQERHMFEAQQQNAHGAVNRGIDRPLERHDAGRRHFPVHVELRGVRQFSP